MKLGKKAAEKADVTHYVTQTIASQNNPTPASRLTQLLFNKTTLGLAAVLTGAGAYYFYRQKQLTKLSKKAQAEKTPAAAPEVEGTADDGFDHVSREEATLPKNKGLLATATSYLPHIPFWGSTKKSSEHATLNNTSPAPR